MGNVSLRCWSVDDTEKDNEDTQKKICHIKDPKQQDETGGNFSTHGIEGTEKMDKKLPIEQLLLLFSYFPLDILIRVQGVCSVWRAAAQDISLWKNFTLTISGTPQDEKYIRAMPALRNIDGNANNYFISVILESVTELSQMNCKFKPPMSFEQTKMLIKKYPELKSITVDIFALDVLQTVNELKTSEHLEEINFTTHCDNIGNSSNISKLYGVLLDNRYFTALTRIDICDSSRICVCASNSCIVHVIKKRSQQLTSLKFTVRERACKTCAEALNACTQLHTLQLSLGTDDVRNNNINIENMTRLKSLTLDTGLYSGFFPTLYDSLYKGSWINMREINLRVFTDRKRKIEILRPVIENMKQLKMLRYCDGHKNTSEKELKGISSLLCLKKLIIDGLTALSEEGLNYISLCRSLQYLLLNAANSTVDKWNVADKVIKMDKLERMVLGLDETNIFLAFRREIDEFISKTKA